jgi:vacuolar-type H+-ATPase subunit I/STV1
MKFCYVKGDRKRISAKKAWETRRRHGTDVVSSVTNLKRSESLKKYWSTHTDRMKEIRLKGNQTRYQNGNYAVSVERKNATSQTLKAKYSIGTLIHWTQTHPEQEVKQKIRKAVHSSRTSKPTRPERKVQELNINNLEFVGNRKFWIQLTKTRAKNPDFVLRPFHTTHRVVEVFGGRGYFHTEAEAKELTQLYKNVNVDCLVIWEEELKDLTKVREILQNYCFDNAPINSDVGSKSGYIGETLEQTIPREVVIDPVETTRRIPQMR